MAALQHVIERRRRGDTLESRRVTDRTGDDLDPGWHALHTVPLLLDLLPLLGPASAVVWFEEFRKRSVRARTRDRT